MSFYQNDADTNVWKNKLIPQLELLVQWGGGTIYPLPPDENNVLLSSNWVLFHSGTFYVIQSLHFPKAKLMTKLWFSVKNIILLFITLNGSLIV